MPPKKNKKPQHAAAGRAALRVAQTPTPEAPPPAAATPQRVRPRAASAAEVLPHRQDADAEDDAAAATPRLERLASRPDPIRLVPPARGNVNSVPDSDTQSDLFRSAVSSFADDMASPAVIPPQLTPLASFAGGALAATGAVTPRLQRGATIGGGPGYASSCARQRGRSGAEAPSEPAPALTSDNMTELWTLASERRRRAAMQAIARLGSLDRLLQARMTEAADIAAEIRQATAAASHLAVATGPATPEKPRRGRTPTAAAAGKVPGPAAGRASSRRQAQAAEQLASVRKLKARLGDCHVSCVQLCAEKRQLSSNIAAHLTATYRRVGRFR
jgi:hypothetical protein